MREKMKKKQNRKGSKKKKEKREGREGGNTQVSNLALGRYLYKGRLTERIFRNLLPFSAFGSALGSIWEGFGLPKPPFWRLQRLIFPWFSSIMHELLQETLACIYCGFSFPLAARRYVRSTWN